MSHIATIVRRTVLLAAVLAASAAAQGPARPSAAPFPPSPVSLDTTGMFRAAAARVGDDLFVTGQPTEAALRQLRAQGVTVVVNLRTPQEMQSQVPFDEAALLKELGITYVHLPVRGTPELPYSPATLDAFSAAVREAKGKVLLHCTVAWRASHLWAAYLIRERTAPVEDALAHARLINLMGFTPANAARLPVEDFLGYALPQLKR